MDRAGGFAPRPPGLIALVPRWVWAGGASEARSRPIPAPESALRSHPCGALSSAPATGKFTPTLAQAARARARILFHWPCKVVRELNSGKGTGTR